MQYTACLFIYRKDFPLRCIMAFLRVSLAPRRTHQKSVESSHKNAATAVLFLHSTNEIWISRHHQYNYSIFFGGGSNHFFYQTRQHGSPAKPSSTNESVVAGLCFRCCSTTTPSTRSPTSPRTSPTTERSATSAARKATTALWPSRPRSRSVFGHFHAVQQSSFRMHAGGGSVFSTPADLLTFRPGDLSHQTPVSCCAVYPAAVYAGGAFALDPAADGLAFFGPLVCLHPAGSPAAAVSIPPC